MYPMPNIAAISVIQSNSSTTLVNHARSRTAKSSQIITSESVSKAPKEPVVRFKGESVRDYLKRSFCG